MGRWCAPPTGQIQPEPSVIDHPDSGPNWVLIMHGRGQIGLPGEDTAASVRLLKGEGGGKMS